METRSYTNNGEREVRDLLTEAKAKPLPIVDEEFMETFLASPYQEQLKIIEELRYHHGLYFLKEGYFFGEKELWRRRLKFLYDWWMATHGEEWASDQIYTFQHRQQAQEEQKEKDNVC